MKAREVKPRNSIGSTDKYFYSGELLYLFKVREDGKRLCSPIKTNKICEPERIGKWDSTWYDLVMIQSHASPISENTARKEFPECFA